LISFRYHLVSIIAVFLALALGILVGTTGLNGAILSDLKKQVRTLRGETSSLRASNDALTTVATNDEKFATTYMKPILAGRLTGRTVAVISAPGTSSKIKNGTNAALTAAGAKVVTQIQLSPNFIDPARAADISSLLTTAPLPFGFQLPNTSDASVQAGAVLGYVLSGRGKPTDLGQALGSFSGLHMLSVNDNPQKATLAVVLSSGTFLKTDPRAKAMPSVVTEFRAYGIKMVVAGDTLSATQAGLTEAVRADNTLNASVSSVDNADTSIGQISTALAMSGLVLGQSGQYGTGTGASSLFPPAVK
jgi:Copper transport outer membrane protein, MctB